MHIMSSAPTTVHTCTVSDDLVELNLTAIICSVVAKKLGCRLKIKFRRLKEELNCPLCFTDSSSAKNPAGNLCFFSQ